MGVQLSKTVVAQLSKTVVGSCLTCKSLRVKASKVYSQEGQRNEGLFENCWLLMVAQTLTDTAEPFKGPKSIS